MAEDPVGRTVQDAWVSHDVVQCGYCQSGQMMSAVALLKSTSKPTDTNIEESMGGNLCGCGTNVRIREAIKAASRFRRNMPYGTVTDHGTMFLASAPTSGGLP